MRFRVSPERGALVEVGEGHQVAGLGDAGLYAVPVCDTDLPHHSHISDEEDYRFQLAVSVYWL